ncbi:hypothetical protein EDB86DRAFT_3110881 [Lactarius hatsudake]|nr:hypothetical protein EDB86DRAFT_3110881 [Lactarius hatsudake]
MAGLPYRSHRLATARSSPSISTSSLSLLARYLLRLRSPSPLIARDRRRHQPLHKMLPSHHIDRPRVPAPHAAFVHQDPGFVVSPIPPVPFKMSRSRPSLPLATLKTPFGAALIIAPILRGEGYCHSHFRVHAPLSRHPYLTLLVSIDSAFHLVSPPYATYPSTSLSLTLTLLRFGFGFPLLSPACCAIVQEVRPYRGHSKDIASHLSSLVFRSRSRFRFVLSPVNARSRPRPFVFAPAVAVANASDSVALPSICNPCTESPPPTNSHGLGSVQIGCPSEAESC